MWTYKTRNVYVQREGCFLHFRLRSEACSIGCDNRVGFDTWLNSFVSETDYIFDRFSNRDSLAGRQPDRRYISTINLDMDWHGDDGLFRAKADEQLAGLGLKLGAYHPDDKYPYYDLETI